MYFVTVILLLLVLPLASVAIEALRLGPDFSYLLPIGKWFVFWAVGVRLAIAGVRQVFQPSFTAIEIFEIHEPKAFVIVRELGFANLSMGCLGLCSLWHKQWVVPAAIVGGLYYGLAGLGHIAQKRKNAKENTAMITDLLAFAVLLTFVLRST
ncbi:MAG: DUF6790 family protein [Bryobacteraceae bacterium]|jgi:hypothetical protein